MFSSVANDPNKYLPICGYVVNLEVFFMKITFVQALCFDISCVRSAKVVYYFINNCKSYIAAPLCIPLV